MEHPSMFSANQWNRWVSQGRKLVRAKSDAQFALGDLTLTMIPKQPQDGEDHGVQMVLEAYANQIGLSLSTLKAYRHVAISWPKERRNPSVSHTIHSILSAQPSRFRKINNPRVDPVSGERRWTVNEALRSAGRTPQHPVTPQERVDRVRDLVADDNDAAAAVKDILRRPAVARQVLEDPSARHILRHASQSQSYYDDDSYDSEDPPTTRRLTPVHYSEAPREILEVLGVCTNFYTQMQRMIPRMHVEEYDDDAKRTLLESIERVRAAAGWAETVINTGDTTMDEALARLLAGE